ncbi:MAG TPA: two-component regulator propeller domain-containing protein, partial [Prolixibacteraceae bacterium]|nr:two-component regulator propeller domain-containing protein [Prolixibacteraceae bacterium]
MNKFQLLVVLSMLFCPDLKGQKDKFYTPSDGLSGTSIHGIFQDSRGYVWISLFSSLNRFDGYSFTVFEHREKDSTAINSTYTNVVFEDSEKRLWIGTEKGLNIFDYDRNCFQQIRLTDGKAGIVLNVKWILEDSDKSLWLATSHGLVNYHPENNHYVYYNHRFQSDGEPSYVDYNQAIDDQKGNIWIGTGNEGVLLFDMKKHLFSTVSEYTGIDYNFPDRTVMSVHQTKTGQILFGTAREGLVVYDPAKGSFIRTKNSDGDENRLDRGIYSIITDRKGIIWLGTEGNGIKTYNLNNNTITDVSQLIDVAGASKSRIYCYEDRQGDMWFGIQERGIYVRIFSSKNFHAIGNSKTGEQLSHYLVSTILIDRTGNFWIGTDGGGINLLRKGEKHFSIFNKTSFGSEIKDKAITKLYEDKRGWVWIGTYYEGLYCYQGNDKPLIHYHIPGFETDAKKDYILDLAEDAKGDLWIGTKGGLFSFQVAKNMITDSNNPFVSGKRELISPGIYALEYDADSTLWIATDQGLNAWNEKKETFRSFQMSKGDLRNNLVTCLKMDNDKQLWVGTLSGLYRYIPGESLLRRYAEEEGLCSSSIKAIESDRENKLWISTTAGIAKYDSKSAVFTNYFMSDGLPCDKYVIGSSF